MFENKHKKALRGVLITIQQSLDTIKCNPENKEIVKTHIAQIQGAISAGNMMYEGKFDTLACMAHREEKNMR